MNALARTKLVHIIRAIADLKMHYSQVPRSFFPKRRDAEVSSPLYHGHLLIWKLSVVMAV